MWKDQNGILYFGDCVLGDSAATPDEVAAWERARAMTMFESAVQTHMDSAAREAG